MANKIVIYSFVYLCLAYFNDNMYIYTLDSGMFKTRVSPMKSRLDSYTLDTVHARSDVQCARICKALSCGAFIYRNIALEDRCYDVGNYKLYTGTWNISYTGRTCQRWDMQYPHTHDRNNPVNFPDSTVDDAANYCRDPDNEGMLWCYTTDPDSRWEFCDVYKCMHDNCRLFSAHVLGSQVDREGFAYFEGSTEP